MSKNGISTVMIAAIIATFVPLGVAVATAATKRAVVAPAITGRPQNASVTFGKVAHLGVAATLTPESTVHWQVSTAGGAFADLGSSSSTLKVTATTTNDGASYRIVVSNSSGSVTSRQATLRIKPPSRPSKVKCQLPGLIDKGSEAQYQQGLPFPVVDLTDVASRLPAFAGIVVNQTWSQLEPGPGQFDFTTCDASLATVAAYDTEHAGAS